LSDAKAQIRAVFSSTDTDGDGTISRKELAAKLKADGEIEAILGIADATTIPQVVRAMRMLDQSGELDPDGDSQITYAEFEAAALARLEPAISTSRSKIR